MSQSDLLALIIAVLAIVTTVLAVWIGFLLTRSYTRQTDEILAIKEEHARVSALLQAAHSTNANNLVHFRLTLRVIFNLIMTQQRREKLARYELEFKQTGVWAGRSVPAERRPATEENIRSELEQNARELQARQHELYWLVETENEGEAYLQAIVDTYGDGETLRLMKGMQALAMDKAFLERLTVARAELGRRLGQPYYGGQAYDHRAWTGRP